MIEDDLLLLQTLLGIQCVNQDPWETQEAASSLFQDLHI